MPTAGSAVATSSYPLCGQISTGVSIAQSVTVDCEPTSNTYQYVIVQSLDTSAEQLCIAEVGVYEGGQFGMHSPKHV